MLIHRLSRWTAVQHSARSDGRLGAILAFVAGAANAGGFLAVGQYTSHVTGIVSSVADWLVLGEILLVLGALSSVLAFLLGAMTTAMLVNLGRQWRLRSSYALPLILEATLLLVFGLLGPALSADRTFLLPPTVLLLCFMMGLQNAMITKFSQAVIRTTHVTGIVTDIGIELGRRIYRDHVRHSDGPLVGVNPTKLRLHTLLLACFLGGGVAGALGFQWIGYRTTVPLALILLALALPPVGMDWRIRRKVHRRRRPAPTTGPAARDNPGFGKDE